MRLVFADSLFYVALQSQRDQHHVRARNHRRTYRGRYLNTEFVLTEVGNFLNRYDGRQAFVDLVRALRTDKRVTIVPASAELFEKGLHLFAARPDKEWSLTDCTSFVVMAEQGVADALTAGQHFAQAGFVPLLV